MNHRERVQTALDHRQPDRVPIDLWGSASRICNELYFRIVRDQGWADLGHFVSASRSGDYVDWRVADLVGCDFRHTNVGKPALFTPRRDEAGNEYNEWGVGFTTVAGAPVIAVHPLAGADESDIAKHPWPNPRDPGRRRGVADQVRRWRETTDYFIGTTSVVSGLMLDIATYLRGFENFMTDLYINKPFAHALIGTLTDLLIEMHVFFLEPIADGVDWVEFASDHGMQDRPMMSVATYREFFKEPYARLFRAIRRAVPGAAIWLHSCGAVRDFIPDFIDIGVDVLNSLQPRAAGMDSVELKAAFGSEIVFHGGLDIQGGLTGAVRDAVDETRRRLDAFAPGGGYILAPSNHFMQDIPLENFYAVYETAREYGGSG